MQALPEPGRRAGGRDDPVFVNHLVLDDDVAGPLEDTGAVAVDGRQNRADDAARDAAIVVAVKLRGVVLPREPPAAREGTLLSLRRQRRQPAVGRVDHQRRRVRELRSALEPVARRVVGGLVFLELRFGPFREVLGDLDLIGLFLGLELGVGQHLALAVLRRPLERHADVVVAGVRAAKVRLAPRGLWWRVWSRGPRSLRRDGRADGCDADQDKNSTGHALDLSYFGVTRNKPPGFLSSSIHTAPSGATSTSRMRCPTLQRSAGVAPPLPSNVMRFSVCDPMPPISAEPFHFGNIAPL